jgi:hypothetical protein
MQEHPHRATSVPAENPDELPFQPTGSTETQGTRTLPLLQLVHEFLARNPKVQRHVENKSPADSSLSHIDQVHKPRTHFS